LLNILVFKGCWSLHTSKGNTFPDGGAHGNVLNFCAGEGYFGLLLTALMNGTTQPVQERMQSKRLVNCSCKVTEMSASANISYHWCACQLTLFILSYY